MLEQPLILTLQLDETSFAFFNALRQQYFPPERNFLSAHLTLFHHLPPGEIQIQADLKQIASTTMPLHLHVAEIKSIGKGVAYKIECPPLLSLHKNLQQAWQHWLTPQDRQKLWPHVTVQNKVSPQEAMQTLEKLRNDFEPFEATGVGFQLWRYDGGPWTLLETYLFD